MNKCSLYTHAVQWNMSCIKSTKTLTGLKIDIFYICVFILLSYFPLGILTIKCLSVPNLVSRELLIIE